MWKQIYENNSKRLNDPYFAHAKKELADSIEEAKQVLTTLGKTVDDML
jgi:hypothetical protein